MKTLAVIIPFYTNEQSVVETYKRVVESLVQNLDKRYTTTITVVDDGSPIPVPELAGVRLVSHPHNLGIACGWNSGWKANATADFYCWLNADCVVTPNWSFPLVVAAEELGAISMPYTNGVKSDGIGITGWCFVARRDVANKIGPFDETFVPARYEDTDWFHRAIFNHGIPLVNVPDSNVLHNRMQGGTKAIQRFEWLHMANRFRYSWKHGVDPNQPPPFWKVPLPDVEIKNLNAS